MYDAHIERCTVCARGDIDIDWNKSERGIAEELGLSRDAVRRHKIWLAKQHGETLVLRSMWTTPGGQTGYSYVNATPVNPELHIDTRRIDKLVAKFRDIVPEVKVHLHGEELLTVGDPQLGKAGEKGGGTPETLARIRASFKCAMDRYAVLQPKTVYLIDGGDIIENIFSVKSQAVSNDRTVPEQIEDAIMVYLEMIRALYEAGYEVVHVTVTSNHTEARNDFKSNPFGSENDWGFFIQRQLKERTELLGWNTVTYVRPDTDEDTAVFTTRAGLRVAVNHGHHSGSPAKVKDWVKGQIVGQRPGWDADIWIMNHFHNDYYFRVGKGQTVFGTPSLDPGSAWFTRKTGESCPPGMLALTVTQGGWSNHTIL